MIVGSAGNAYISRNNSSYFDPSLDFTKSFYIRTSRTPLVNVTCWLFGADIAYTPPYVWFGTSVASTDSFFFEFDTGSGAVDSSTFAVAHSTNVYVSLRYTKAAHTLELLFDGVVKDTKTANFDTFTAQPFDGMLNDGSSDDSTCSVAYERFYQRALSNTEILAEMASIVPVNSTMLLSSCPLQTSIDLTDHYQKYLAVYFPTSGTVITNTTDPLLSIVAGPPTNTTPATATVVTTDSAYFQDTLTAGAATTVWHKITCIADAVWGMGSFGDLATYKPQIDVFEGLANANSNTHYKGVNGAPNLMLQLQVTAGNDYYFKSTRNGAVSPAILQLSILTSLDLLVPIGSIMINDDTYGNIAALDVNTGYPLKFFNIPLNPTGEGGCPLNDGTIVLCNDDNVNPAIYDLNFNLIADLAGITANQGTVSSNLIDTFAIGRYPLSGDVRLVSKLGVIDPIVYAPSIGASSIGLNVDVSKLYYTVGGSANQPVKTWIIATNSVGTDLYAAVTTEFVPKGPITVLQNGIILIPRFTTNTHHFVVQSVNSSGTPIHTYDLGLSNTTSSNDSRLATDPADPVFFWAWGKETTAGFSYFNKITTSSGSLVINLRNITQYESGIYGDGIGNTNTPVRFGHSESCSFWINRTGGITPVKNRSGIYYLTGTGSGNPTQRHDTLWIDASLGTTEDVKIP